MYVYYIVYYCVIATPHVRNVSCSYVFAHLYNLVDDLENFGL